MKLFIAILLIVADVAVPDEAKCNSCFEKDADDCTKNQVLQHCSRDKTALGKSHCASVAGKVLDFYGKTREIFFRGCIDCSDKKGACFALGGSLKGNDDTNGTVSLQKCAIECCKGSSCNNQVPTLTQDAINVFTQAASGPKQCNLCLDSDAAKCFNNSQTQVCAADLKSLGTTHCGSSVGKYREGNRTVREIFFRGCINCADKKVACAILEGYFVESIQLECEIECCTGDNCNTKFPSKDGSPTKSPTQEGHRVLLSEKLAFATVLGVIVYLF